MKDLLNKMVTIDMYREKPKQRIGRVVEVRDTHERPVRYRTYQRNKIARSRYLVTIHDLQVNVFRSYYDEFLKCTCTIKPM